MQGLAFKQASKLTHFTRKEGGFIVFLIFSNKPMFL